MGSDEGRAQVNRSASHARGADLGLLFAHARRSYYTTITVGTPPVSYEVVLDTGSADLVLATEEGEACFGAGNTNCDITASLYAPSLSNSSVTTSQAVDVTYGTGSASGTIVKDTMTFAGFTATQVSRHTPLATGRTLLAAHSLTSCASSIEQNIAACPNVTDLVTSADQSGLWGLAFQSLSASNSMPFLQGLYNKGLLASPEFAFGFADLSIDDTRADAVVPGGTMTVGGTNSSLYSGSINYVSLTESQYWSIPLDGISVGGTSLGITDPGVVIDTGTNGLVVPDDVAAAIYAAIPGSKLVSQSSGEYLYPCSTNVALAFTFGGVQYTMPASDFNYGRYSGSNCIGAVSGLGVSSTSSSAIYILGTPMLFSLYNVYRFNPPAVGFATLATTADATFDKQAIPTSNGTNTGSHPAATGTVSGGGIGYSGASGVTPKGAATLAALAGTVIVLAVGLGM